MAKPAEKFYIVAESNNPQLGTYLSDVIAGKKRVNKCSISCCYDYYGDSRTLKFTQHSSSERNNGHFCIDNGSCCYGSMTYIGFDSAADAKAYLDANWKSSSRYESLSKKLDA